MKSNTIKNFKEKLRNNDNVIGPFSKTCDPAFIETMGYAGYDFVILDLEHGPNSVETIQNLVRAAQIANILPIVRVKEDNSSVIGEVLDIGAGGIQVPQITNAKQAKETIQLAKFAPIGMRGVCRFVRAANYSSMDRFQYFKEANETIIILQLEGQEAIDNLSDIIKVEGIDIIFIGPYDLSQSLGVSGQIDHPAVEEKMVDIIEECKKHGIVVGTFVDSTESAIKWRDKGVRYISYSVDVGIFYDGCKNTLNKIRK